MIKIILQLSVRKKNWKCLRDSVYIKFHDIYIYIYGLKTYNIQFLLLDILVPFKSLEDNTNTLIMYILFSFSR